MKEKNHCVRRSFDSCNFSLILRGSGVYRRGEEVWQVKAPCVITQWPGVSLEYGPSEEAGTWDEFYIIYDSKLLPHLERCGFLEWDRPIWQISNRGNVNGVLEKLLRMMRSGAHEVVDRVDRLCEQLVLETLIDAHSEEDNEALTHRVIRQVMTDMGAPLDLAKVASEAGMSLSTLRRKWKELHNVPPGRFFQQMRIREACRLLVETADAIGEIARRVGFEDELYFSRCFRKEMKMPPRDYRKAFRYQPLNNRY